MHNLIRNTTPKNAINNGPFGEKNEIALDTALILYLLHEAPLEEQNFEMVMYMIENPIKSSAAGSGVSICHSAAGQLR